jgi:phosphoenolpyruvate carboxykinase (ATP)
MSRVMAPKEKLHLSVNELLDIALDRGEGVLSADKAFAVTTGKRTGRSPLDRFIVCDDITKDTVDWGVVNQPASVEHFSRLWQKASTYMDGRECFVNELQVGADTRYALPVKVVTELAWHNVFCQHLFIERASSGLDMQNEWTILNAAKLKMDSDIDETPDDGVVMINFTEKKVLLCGMLYAGEMKKAMFTALNYLLPTEKVLPMHCAANCGEDGDVALFFGLSGTGKTTLSADPSRYLIGDDEHGWGLDTVFNFEGGCYAKCIDLSREREPVIWDAIRDGAILENVVLDENGVPDYSDSSNTLNTRSGYPRHHIPKRVEKNQASLPNAVIFLTCDLYGVLPPVSMLSVEQAAYYFLSGYTALVGSTEVGSNAAIKPTFSTCFGAPFFPRPAQVYADLLMEKVKQSDVPVYLVNTGWTGGAYGEGGQRFSIPVTRRVVAAAISGELLEGECITYPGFNFKVPKSIRGVGDELMHPVEQWTDADAFKAKVNYLIGQFKDNFTRFDVDADIISAGPDLI